jgi:signal transduction histidine kinase
VKTLRSLVAELLNITAIETGNFQLHRSNVNVAAIARRVVETVGEKARVKAIELTLDEQSFDSTKTALADEEALALIFSNLIDNAIKYTPQGGTIMVRTAQNGMYLSFSVKDTGVGINAEELDKVFDEFYRIKNEDTLDIPGTGLGLSLVKRLVDLHQGRIEAESMPGSGSVFTVKIPLS